MWWQNAVIYQIYPRSFQDSDGDGAGDLPGIVSRLDYVRDLGAQAIWLSPFYPSPNTDFGYDVTDYTAVDPAYGTLEDFDRLVAGAYERDLKVIVDFVPCHTSVEHPWFREHPDYYFWADAPANNWLSVFGGSAWARDPATGRYYMHSFFPEQADLNWRNPDVRAAMADAVRFWRARGVDGFRLDAIARVLKDAELRDDPPATELPPLPFHGEYSRLDHVHSMNPPDVGLALRTIREAAGDAVLIGEAYLRTADLGPFLETLDVMFAFEAMNAGGEVEQLRSAITAAVDARRLGWVVSNHDFTRFATRLGENLRPAALLFLSLPGPVFIFEGDELGVTDGPGVEPPLDRHGRDPFRHPMPWDASDTGGFTTGTPWLPPHAPQRHNVADQDRDEHSVLALFRRVIALRRGFGSAIRFLDSAPGTIVLEREGHLIAVNLGAESARVPRRGELVLETRKCDGTDPDMLPAHAAWIARIDDAV